MSITRIIVNKFIQWNITPQWNKWTATPYNNIDFKENTVNEKNKSQKTTYRMLPFLYHKKVKLNSILLKEPCNKSSIIKKKVMINTNWRVVQGWGRAVGVKARPGEAHAERGKCVGKVLIPLRLGFLGRSFWYCAS